MGDVPRVVFCHTEPGLFAFLADIAPDDEMAAVFQEGPDVFSGVIAGIKPKKQGAICQPAADADGFRQKFQCAILTVLFPPRSSRLAGYPSLPI